MTFAEQCARDARLALGPDGRDGSADENHACPCGKPVIEVEERFDMIGGCNRRHLYYWHSRVDYCHFRRVF